MFCFASRDWSVCSGDDFKKETQKMLSFFKSEQDTETENLDKEWADELAASDKGSYFEQDKLSALDGLDEEQDEAVPAFSACLGTKSRRKRIWDYLGGTQVKTNISKFSAECHSVDCSGHSKV